MMLHLFKKKKLTVPMYSKMVTTVKTDDGCAIDVVYCSKAFSQPVEAMSKLEVLSYPPPTVLVLFISRNIVCARGVRP